MKIFLSSTTIDLKDHRDRVVQAIERLGQSTTRMEVFGARPDSPLQECQRLAAQCDAMVVIVAHRYGWIPSETDGGDGKRSITWYEVDAAREAEKPIFVFLVDDKAEWSLPTEQDLLTAAESDEAATAIYRSVRSLQEFKKALSGRIRDTFSTPADLAEKVSSSLAHWLLDRNNGDASVKNILLRAAERELRADRFARLDQSGKRDDTAMPLSDVFIDLEFATKKDGSEDPRRTKDSRERGQALESVLEKGRIVQTLLTAGNVMVSKRDRKIDDRESRDAKQGFVIVGGAGYGKSTLTQMIAQLYRRAVLLKADSIIIEESRTICRGLQDVCERNSLPEITLVRYPIRVILRDFASWLPDHTSDAVSNPDSHAASATLADFLASQLGKNEELSGHNIRDYFRKNPVFLLLDGLDEVPASSNRPEVLAAIEDFLAEVTGVSSDILVVVTTRGESYFDEFRPGLYEHLSLGQLAPKLALQYGERLIEWMSRHDQVEAHRRVQELRQAASNPLTMHLMSTPLHVTFMVIVIAAGGVPPQQRYPLFVDYFDTIYKREQQKSIRRLRGVLADFRPVIERIHHLTGYFLHVRAELAGKSDATLKLTQFRELVTNVLIEERGLEKMELTQTVEVVMSAVMDRLVILACRRDNDNVGFELTSLREFTAAQLIISGSDRHRIGRLKRVVMNSHWANVVQFVVGSFFADAKLGHLRAEFLQLCRDLNAGNAGEGERIARAGAHLAYAVFADEPSPKDPLHEKRLLDNCFAIWDVPNPEIQSPADTRLSNIQSNFDLGKKLAQVPQRHIGYVAISLRDYIAASRPLVAIGAWRTAAYLLDGADQNQGNESANDVISSAAEAAAELFRRWWPLDGSEQTAILRGSWISAKSSKHPAAREVIRRCLKASNPFELIPRGGEEYFHGKDEDSEAGKLGFAFSVALNPMGLGGKDTKIELTLRGESMDSLTIAGTARCGDRDKLTEYYRLALAFPTEKQDWEIVRAAWRFGQSPSASSLAAALLALSEISLEESLRITLWLPWPLQVIVDWAREPSRLRSAAELVASGGVGDVEDWIAAEQRWDTIATELGDFGASSEKLVPFDRGIAASGAVAFSITSLDVKHLDKLLGALPEMDHRLGRDLAAGILSMLLSGMAESGKTAVTITAHQLKAFLEGQTCSASTYDLMSLLAVELEEGAAPDVFEIIDAFGRRARFRPVERFLPRGVTNRLVEKIKAAYVLDGTRTGLLCVLAHLQCHGYHVNLTSPALNVDDFEKPRERLAAIVFGVCRLRSIQDTSVALKLATELAALESTERSLQAVNTVLAAFETMDSTAPTFDSFLAYLYDELGAENWSARGAVYLTAVLRLSRRPSCFGQPDVARELGLPEESRYFND